MSHALISAPAYPITDAAPTSYTNLTTLTAFNPGDVTEPAFFWPGMLKRGTVIEIEAFGTISTSGTTPTFIWSIALGQAVPPTAAGAVVLAGTTAFTLTNQAAVAWPWRAHYRGLVTKTGSSGQIIGSGSIDISTSLTAFTPRNIPETTAARTVTVNCNVAQAVLMLGTWSAAAATNIAVCEMILGVAHG